MSAAAQPAGVRGKGFWAGVIGLALFCLVGISQGMSGVLIFAGMYLLGTALWHMLRGRSWLTGLGLGGRRQGVGAAVASVMALGAGGAMAPKPAPVPAPAPLVAQVSSTPSQTPSQTPIPSATPTATATSTPSPVVTPSATPTASKPVVTPKATASPSQTKLRVAPAPAATRTTQAPPAPLVRRPTEPAAPATKATHKVTSDSGTSSDSGSSSGSGVGTVHAGSFCSDAGASGVSAKGKPMVCGEAKDGRLRWKRA